MRALLKALWLAHAIFLLCGASALGKPQTSYKAAAAQVPCLGNLSNSPATNVALTMTVFERLAQQAGAQGAEIIVFPELVLYWAGEMEGRGGIYAYSETVPMVQNGIPRIVPATNSSYPPTSTLRRLSELAKNSGLVVVANMVDRQPCQPAPGTYCPADGRFQFNTDVVFGPSGELLAKYHKSHLIGETPALDEPLRPDPGKGMRTPFILIAEGLWEPGPLSLPRRRWWLRTRDGRETKLGRVVHRDEGVGEPLERFLIPWMVTPISCQFSSTPRLVFALG